MYTMYKIGAVRTQVHKAVLPILPVRFKEEFTKYLSFGVRLTPKAIVRILSSFVFGALYSYDVRREKPYVKTSKFG